MQLSALVDEAMPKITSARENILIPLLLINSMSLKSSKFIDSSVLSLIMDNYFIISDRVCIQTKCDIKSTDVLIKSYHYINEMAIINIEKSLSELIKYCFGSKIMQKCL